MKKFSLTLWTFLALVLVGTLALAERPAHEKGKGERSLAKTAYEPDRYQILNINNLWTWHRRDGQANHSPLGDNGTFYPRGTAWAIYQDGMVFGSRAYVDAAKTIPAPFSQNIRVGGTTYATGQREGWVTGQGATAAPIDPADPRARIYRVRRDWTTAFYNADGTFSDEAKRDAAESNEIGVSAVTNAQVQAIIDRYLKDWSEWPVDLGAPYVERNGQPGYQAPPPFSDTFTSADLITGNYDEPGVAGSDPNSPADQVLWCVFNDLNKTTSVGRFGSEPTGLEIQMTMWGYKRSDALGNIFFRKWRFINKGGVEIDAAGSKGAFYLDSMYVCQWSDPDLGNAGDDLLGCDTTLSMGFVYNANALDSEYRRFNLAPPAAGYDFLQGPIIASPGDRAVFDLKYKDGYKNLGMSGFSYFSAGSPYTDPSGGYGTNTIRWYKMLRGYAPLDGPDARYAFPPGVEAGPFPLAGNPVTGNGHVDGQGFNYSFVSGDRRLLVITGPFSMAPGDTQEVVVAHVAGLGSDRLSSVSVMKFNDRFAQNTYDALFQVPRAPAPPDVQATELNGEIILEWGSNLNRVNNTENTINEPGNFKFEGYNIYQVPSPTSRLSEGVRIATFDLTSDPAVVLGEDFDARSGQILEQALQFGSNSGIRRYFRLSRDYVKDVDKLNNGEEYYFAVTSYSVSTIPGYLPAALESDVQIRVVRPKVPFGTKYKTSFGDTLQVAHTSTGTSISDGIVYPIVIDPRVSNGKTYEVKFATDAQGATVWSLAEKGGTVVMGNQSNQSGDTNYNIVNGLFLVVSGPPPGLKSYTWTPSANRFLTWAGGDFGFEGFNGAIGYGSPRSVFGDGTLFVSADQTKNIEIRFANVNEADGSFDPNHPNVSYAYRHGRGFGSAPARPEFAPFIINTGGSYSYQDFTKSVPLAVYDIENPAAPRRLAVAFLENNAANGSVDGKYWPPYTGAPDNIAGDGPREWLWIFDSDYSETPNSEYQAEIIGGPQPVMYFATWARRNHNNWVDTDVFTHISNKPNTQADVFTFTLPAPDASAELALASAKNIGVFPNPYYAFNPQETSRLSRFVTFNNLPPNSPVTIRIFNLAGQLVNRIEKNDASQFIRWNLLNFSNLPVASGMYIAHIEIPELGHAQVLKLAVIQEGEVLENF